MTLSQLLVKLNNIVQIGTIHESKILDGRHLARVILDDDGINKRVSPFIPVKSLANSFGRAFFPIRSGEQVIVISPFGNINGGFIIRSIFHKKCQVPSGANDNTAIVEFEDGTRLSYNSEQSELKMDVKKIVNILCEEVSVKASKSAYLEAPTTMIKSNTTVDGTLTVTKLFTAQGGMKVFPSASGAIGAIFEAEIVSNKDITALNLKATEKVYDSHGDLTDHTNNSYTRD